MNAEEIDELERLMTAATPGPWSWTRDDASMLTLHGADGMEDHILTTQRCKACADRGAPCLDPSHSNAAAIVALHNHAPALIAAARDLAWHEDRHGTRAEQEAEDAELDADLARIASLSDEECKAELAAEGIDYDAARKKFDAMIKVCAERAELKREVDRLRAFMPRWKREDGMWTLRVGTLMVARISQFDGGIVPVVREDNGGRRVLDSAPDVESAARAVCDRLGIPDVEVPS